MAYPNKVEKNVVVKLAYRLTVDHELVESTDDDGPIEYLQGVGEIIPGLENSLYGMEVGEEQSITIAPENGYGDYDETAIEEVPLDNFPDDIDLSLGMPIELYDEEADESVEGYVAEIRTDTVVIDMNHPLAGEVLDFYVQIVGLRPATEDEIEHGHAHYDGDTSMEDEDE